MSHTRSTFPYADDREVVAHFLSGARKPRGSTMSPLEARDGALRWDANRATVGSGASVAWFNPTDGALMGKLLAGADHHPGVVLIHAVAHALGAPEMRVTRESSPLEIRAGGHKSAPVIGISPDARRHRFFFAGTPVQLDQPFLIVGPMAVAAYRAALNPKAKR